MSGNLRADNTRTLLVDLLAAAASTSPLLIVLEDAHSRPRSSSCPRWRA